MVAAVPTTKLPAESRIATCGCVVKALRFAAPAAALSKVNWAASPKLNETAREAPKTDGVEISAEMVLDPIKPSSAMFEKVAIPAEAEMAAVPEIVEPVEVKVTV